MENSIESDEMKKMPFEETKKTRHLGRQWVKTNDFEKFVAINMLWMKSLLEVMKKNKNFRSVLEYDAEAMDVNINYFTDGADESPEGDL